MRATVTVPKMLSRLRVCSGVGVSVSPSASRTNSCASPWPAHVQIRLHQLPQQILTHLNHLLSQPKRVFLYLLRREVRANNYL
jgi:hypothetical protein